ncbi:MFS transporter [Spirillospora sp. NPDC047279]|uniref:MFS transporter n=1 Tax=Spirillospora sp. NPDC047279 TaxID=3155478 RepID=UPI0033ECA7D7
MSGLATVTEGRPPGGGPAPVPLRRNRDFQVLWIGQSVAHLGNQIALLAYPLLILAVHGTAALAGVLGFAAYAAGLAARLPAGAFCDRADRRRTMAVSEAVRALAMAALAVAVIAGAVPVWLVIVVAVVDSVGLELFRFAERGALRHIVHPSQVSSALARNEARAQAAALAGPALGGWLFAVGRGLPFGVNAVTHALASLAVLTIRRPLRERPAPAGNGVAAPAGGVEERAGGRAVLQAIFHDGFGWIRRTPELRVLLLAAVGPNLVFGAAVLAIVAAAEDGGASGTTIGTALSAASLGGLLGAVAAPALLRRLRPPAVLLGSAWLLAATIAGLALLSDRTWAMAALLCGAIFTVPVFNTLFGTYQIQLTPDALQGRVAGAATFVTGAAQPFGPLLGGLLFDAAGPAPTFALLAGLLALSALALTALPSARRLPAITTPREGGPVPAARPPEEER